MSVADCLAEVAKAAGRDLTEPEAEQIADELAKRFKDREGRGDLFGDDLWRAVGDEYAADIRTAAFIERRNAAINSRLRIEALDMIRNKYAGQEERGLEALLVGINSAQAGSRASAAAEQAMLKNYYFGGLASDLERGDLFKILANGAMDREIANVMWRLGRGEAIPENIPEEAVKIAAIINRWQEVARNDANEAGAWIGQIDGYIVRQSHDQLKIMAATFEQWRDAVLPKLDPKTFKGADPDKFLRGVYRALVSGDHMKVNEGVKNTAFKGSMNIAKKASQERVLHFKSADDWFDYNQQFGSGSLREAVARGLDISAETTGLMRKLGTNPRDNLERIITEIRRGFVDPARSAQLDQYARGKVEHFMAELDGTTRSPVHGMAAKHSSNARAITNMTKLGAAIGSQISDLPLYASEFKYQGESFLGSIGAATANLFKGRNRKEMAEVDGMIGVAMDSMRAAISSRDITAGDLQSGVISNMQRWFFKLNLMQYWTDTLRAGAARAMSHRLALRAGDDWAGLGDDLRRVLGLYNIDGGKWDIIRKTEQAIGDGKAFVVPDNIMKMPDDMFKAYLQSVGRGSSEQSIRRLKRQMADDLRMYYVDRASYAVIEPDARTKAFMQRGTQPGTVEGEALRFMGQFKSFSVSVLQKAVGRELFGRGSDTWGQALRNGNGEMLGMARMAAMSLAFGYIAMSTKDLMKGRTPRSLDDPKTWFAAMAQGGGLGIYGDFLFGEMKNRHGGGFLQTLAGPVPGNIQSIADLWGRVREGDDSAAQAFKFVLNNTPFMNLFYVRPALDYFALWHIQEWMNPGSLKRMEARIERENSQTFLIKPSEVVRGY